MYNILSVNLLRQLFLPLVHFLVVGFVHREILSIEFHLTKIDNMVGTLNQKINLGTVFLVIPSYRP